MQIHNLVDWRTHLPALRQWKAQGRIRYIGLTHYTASAYREIEAALRADVRDRPVPAWADAAGFTSWAPLTAAQRAALIAAVG